MRVLALDAATEACSVALLTKEGLCGRFQEVGRSHAEELLGMVEAVLAEAHCTLSMLDGIAASVGPGAFTGVRISVSVAQGLAFGAGLKVVAVTTLEALAWDALRAGETQIVACLDARLGEVYWGCYAADAEGVLVARGTAAVGPPASVKVPFSGVVQGIGRGFRAYPDLAALAGVTLAPGAAETLPDARQMARLGAIRFAAGEGVDPADISPLYLRDKVALTEVERAAAKRTPR